MAGTHRCGVLQLPRGGQVPGPPRRPALRGGVPPTVLSPQCSVARGPASQLCAPAPACGAWVMRREGTPSERRVLPLPPRPSDSCLTAWGARGRGSRLCDGSIIVLTLKIAMRTGENRRHSARPRALDRVPSTSATRPMEQKWHRAHHPVPGGCSVHSPTGLGVGGALGPPARPCPGPLGTRPGTSKGAFGAQRVFQEDPPHGPLIGQACGPLIVFSISHVPVVERVLLCAFECSCSKCA